MFVYLRNNFVNLYVAVEQNCQLCLMLVSYCNVSSYIKRQVIRRGIGSYEDESGGFWVETLMISSKVF